MTKPYQIYSLPREGNWIRAEIVAETPDGKSQGIVDFKREFQYYDASVEHETGTTAVVRRFYRL